MSSIEVHVAKSLENVHVKHPELFKRERSQLELLIPALHAWLDDYAGKKGKGYDYTGTDNIKHREQRHHHEGITEIRRLFSIRYGDEFATIIKEEAEKHIRDDMGYIPFRSEYEQVGFWKRLRGW